MGIFNISQGGVSAPIVDVKVVSTIALKACASNIILYHNHPSGETDPSDADIKLTKRLLEVGELFDIKILNEDLGTQWISKKLVRYCVY